MAAGGDGQFQCSCIPLCHACFASVSRANKSCSQQGPSTRSVAVDRVLPSRVPTIVYVCSAAEKIFSDSYLLLEEPGQLDCSHDFFVSDARDRADERGKDLCDADVRGIIVQAVWGQAADYDAKIPNAIAKYPLRLAWLASAPADQLCERGRDVAIEILFQKAAGVGVKPDHKYPED